MATAIASTGVGELLRTWRNKRRLSQLDLSLEANVSARHLSFIETGRARPSRQLLLKLAEQLEVPLWDRNTLLLAAGFAPVYRETPLEDESMLPVRNGLQKILSGHEPLPAIVVDRHWDILSSNRPAQEILAGAVAEPLLVPPVNAMRIALHPEGLAPRIVNLSEFSRHVLSRLQRQAALAPDPDLDRLLDELTGYPGVDADGLHDPSGCLLTPLVLDSPVGGHRLSLFATVATFGTAVDITLAELSIESFFPADRETDAALRTAFSDPAPLPAT
jgi:transcriptional regulator with XRE-family HTH domain